MINDFDFITTCDISGFIKEDIRAILLYKSNVNENDIVLDINSGVGEISTEFSNLSKEVYCIDNDKNALEFSKQNIKKHGNIDRVRFIESDERDALEKIDSFDIAILKAKDSDFDKTIERIHEKINSKGRIFILTNILDYVLLSVKKLDELNYNPQIDEINVSKGQLLYKGLKFVNENPMTIISVKKR